MDFGFRGNTAIAGLSLFGSLLAAGWTELNSGTTADLYAVHFPEGTQVGYAVGALPESLDGFGVVVKTTDGGSTWELQDPGTMASLRSVYFKDNDNGYAVGEAGTALTTTDGGSTWNPMTVPGGTDNSLTYVRFPENGQVGYIGVYPHVRSAKVFKTTDGGGSWTEQAVGGPADWSYSCGFANDSIGVVIGFDGLVVGTSGRQDPSTTADLIAAAFSPTDPNTGYLIGNDSMQGVIRHTDDGGATPWVSVTCEPVPEAVYGVDLATTNVAYACGSDGFIARSRVPTHFQQTMHEGHADLHGVCFPVGADTGFAVGTGGVILRTYDGGNPMSVAEEKGPVACRAGIRVVSNPSRRGVTFRSDTKACVVVYDAAGRVVTRRVATKGVNQVPLPRGGVYVVKVTTGGFSTTQKAVVEH
jgi:photosystem II stability/assembly factor-like uncharacterized protein